MQVKRTILKVLLVLTMLAAVLTMCSALARTSGTHVAAAAPKPLTPAQKVAHLSLQRTAPQAVKNGGKMLGVTCKVTGRTYIYLCDFRVKPAVGKSYCAATYVHWNPSNPSYGKPYKVNLWATAWPCSTKPPLAPPAYPGDGGPAS